MRCRRGLGLLVRCLRGSRLAGALSQGLRPAAAPPRPSLGVLSARASTGRLGGRWSGVSGCGSVRGGRKILRSCAEGPMILRFLRDPVANAVAFGLVHAEDGSCVEGGLRPDPETPTQLRARCRSRPFRRPPPAPAEAAHPRVEAPCGSAPARSRPRRQRTSEVTTTPPSAAADAGAPQRRSASALRAARVRRMPSRSSTSWFSAPPMSHLPTRRVERPADGSALRRSTTWVPPSWGVSS